MRARVAALGLAALVGACGEGEPTGPSGADDTGTAELSWLAPLDRGHFEAGVLTHTFVDSRGKELTVEVWYPAAPEAGAEPDPYPELPIVREAYREAPADLRGAPYALVAFSHGFGGIRYQSVFLTEHLARHGNVVVAPDHPHNTLLDMDEDLTGQVAVERPGDITESVDELIRLVEAGEEGLGGLLAGPVAEEPYAVLGHSFGSITALAVGGGDFDIAGLMSYCEAEDTRPCGFLEGIDPDSLDLPEAVADPRVRATVPMSPGLWYAFQPDGSGLASVTAPLVLGGDQDSLMDLETEITPVYTHAAAPKALGVLAKGGHYAFSDICEIAPFFDDCGGPEEGWIPIEDAHAITNHVLTAWLGLHLRGDTAYEAELGAEALGAFPELSWTSEAP